MNILWMTLLAGIGLSLASAMQYKNMRQDYWWHRVSRYYSVKKEQLAYEFQRQQFFMIDRDMAYLGELAVPLEDKEKGPSQEEKATLEKPSVKRIKLYPMNTRLPFYKRAYLEGASSAIWQAAYWRLVDALYGKQEFYASWREGIDQQAFLNELFEQISQINQQYQGAGTWGLALVQFQDETTQQVWQRMLRGSDRSGTSYPSLMGYLWPTDLISGGYKRSLSLAYANRVTLEAMMGPEFTQLWLERSRELKLQAFELSEKLQGQEPNVWVLVASVNELLFQALCTELSIDATAYKDLVDFSGPRTQQAPEILLRNEQGLDYIQSSQVPKRRSKKS